MAYSTDLRQRVLSASAGGMTSAQVANVFQVSISTVERWCRQYRETGQVRAGSSTGRRRRIPPDQEPQLVAQLEAHSDATLVEHCQRWETTSGVALSPATMCRTLQRLGWTLKKST